jgi:hypothetical protein
MKLDHVSYVTTHEQLADTVQRIGSRIGSAFIDGGIHPRFGTRNFTMPLVGGQYVEIVCPLDHPASEQTPWGKAVNKKAQEGGGWLTWVFSTSNLSVVEEKFGRKAIEGQRRLPNGTELKWKQIGVTEIFQSREFPFFIEWLTNDHPSKDGNPVSKIESIHIIDNNKLNNSWFKAEIEAGLDGIFLSWENESLSHSGKGITGIEFSTPNGKIFID